VRRQERLVCIGQKQVWFLLQFTGEEADLRLDRTEHPEFDQWRWVDFWYPAEHVVLFKRGVYRSALRHLAPFARQIAGAQAVPPPLPHLREEPRRRRPPPRGRAVPQRGEGSGGSDSN
jgi:putative (di)nucleoside polyphosphate hydrolase